MKNIVIGLIVFVASQAFAQKQFPVIIGSNLEDKQITLPLANGKFTVLAIAFSRGAEDDLKRWLNPLYETFIHKDKNAGGLSSAEVYDVNFFFVPLISGFKKFGDEFKKNTDKELWQYIIDTDKTDVKDLEKKLDIKDTKIPYFFVLNKEGKILETQTGVFQPQKMDKLEDAVE